MKRLIIVEDIIIIISILSLWPVIFRLPGRGYIFFMYISLFFLLIILINRIRRIYLLSKKNKNKK